MNQDISPPTSNQNSNVPQGFGSSPAPEAPAPQEPVGRVIPLQSGPKKSRLKAVFLTLLFLVLLGAVAGAYYYQQGKIDDISTAKITSDKQVVSLQTQLNAKSKDTKATTVPTSTAPDYTVVTGDVTTQASGTATINTLYKPIIKEIWLEYGTTPDALATASKHVVNELGAGDVNSYGQQSFNLTGLKAGQNYFYRVAAKSSTGTTIYGGVTSFTSTK
ncbi:MAG: fibronectin type III domain-containing protein [Candidatus Saccharimonadales bacterium]